MKEWALKHPWMTFFLLDSAVAGVVKIVTGIINCITNVPEINSAEELGEAIKEEFKEEASE